MLQMVEKCNPDSINRTISDQGRPWLGAVFVIAPIFVLEVVQTKKLFTLTGLKERMIWTGQQVKICAQSLRYPKMPLISNIVLARRGPGSYIIDYVFDLRTIYSMSH